MRNKVCHLTSVHDSRDVRIFLKECTSLAKNGFEVYLVAKGESREENNVKIIGVGDAPTSRFERIVFFTRKIYRKGLELDCDIYHIHDPELLPIAMKLKRKGKNVIYDSHELYYDQIRIKPYLNVFFRNVLSFFYRVYEEYVLKRIDAVIFPCLIDGKNPFEGKCSLIEIINNYPIIEELYDRYNDKCIKTERSACYVGSVTADRGVTNFIKAIAKVNGVGKIGGGFGSKEYEEELRQMPEFKNITYYGVLNRKQVFDILNSSMIGMAVLRNVGQYNKVENLPTKVYEYMALGMPVIMARNPYNEKIMAKYKFGICVNPDNINEIAEAMEKIFTNMHLRKDMGINGRRAVKTDFNWTMEAKKLVNLYANILK